MTRAGQVPLTAMDVDVDACQVCDVGESCAVYWFDDGTVLTKCLACGWSHLEVTA